MRALCSFLNVHFNYVVQQSSEQKSSCVQLIFKINFLSRKCPRNRHWSFSKCYECRCTDCTSALMECYASYRNSQNWPIVQYNYFRKLEGQQNYQAIW